MTITLYQTEIGDVYISAECYLCYDRKGYGRECYEVIAYDCYIQRELSRVYARPRFRCITVSIRNPLLIIPIQY